MAELISRDRWHDPDSPVAVLATVLPDEYVVVDGPVVCGRALDVVVLGPHGVDVLYLRDWEGAVTPSARGPWREEAADGQVTARQNLAAEARKAGQALRRFLKDEFPGLRPEIRHLLVLGGPNAWLTTLPAAMGLQVTRLDGIRDALLQVEPLGRGLPDAAERLALGTALHERRLTASQRTKTPFVFRSGGVYGSGKKVWTVRAAVRHMRRHPSDGAYHLGNGTLTRWLADEGAEHLARLSQETPTGQEWDPRARLEHFLVGTGLVRRPGLAVRPRTINLGFAIPGDTRSCPVHFIRRRGQGYLFGTLEGQEPWLRAEPQVFGGTRSGTTVSANTDGLPISRRPRRTGLLVTSNAAEQPTTVPVRLRLVGVPGRLDRYMLRPLVGCVVAGLLGAAVGAVLGRLALQEPSVRAALVPGFWGAAPVWGAGLGLIWAILGTIRGAQQPAPWPVVYAAGRWLLRLLAWAAGLVLLAAAGYWAWERLAPVPAGAVRSPAMGTVLLAVLAVSVLPATLADIGAARRGDYDPLSAAWRPVLRPFATAVAWAALVVLFAAEFPGLSQLWVEYGVGDAVSSAGVWVEERSTEWAADLDEFIEAQTLRRYDRRAPLSPTMVPSSTAPVVSSEGGSDG